MSNALRIATVRIHIQKHRPNTRHCSHWTGLLPKVKRKHDSRIQAGKRQKYTRGPAAACDKQKDSENKKAQEILNPKVRE